MADGEQARVGGADSLDERRSHACAGGKSCREPIVRAAKAVSGCRLTVCRGDGARPRPAHAYLAWKQAPRRRRLAVYPRAQKRLQNSPELLRNVIIVTWACYRKE